MDFGRMLLTWATYSKRVAEPPLTDAVWAEFKKRQKRSSRDAVVVDGLAAAGLETKEQASDLVQRL
eukprot:14014375-Alexandrium_andersonii.AAC.1